MHEDTDRRKKLPLTPYQEQIADAARRRFNAPFISPEQMHAMLPQSPVSRPLTEYQKIRELSEDEVVRVAKVALRWSEEVWSEAFEKNNKTYETPTLVLYREKTMSKCGAVLASHGPMYCHGDNKMYLDPDFHRDAQSDFLRDWDEMSMAYVVFHEVAHSVQKQVGIMDSIEHALKLLKPNEHVQRLKILRAKEQQADYLAGFGLHEIHRKKSVLDDTDPEKAYWSAVAVGDDITQYRRSGLLNHLSMEHGSARDRAGSFWLGFTQSDLEFGLKLENFMRDLEKN